MIPSLPRKLAIFLLLTLCAPLYLLLRFYYGSGFFKLLGLALVLHVVALPYALGYLAGEPAFSDYANRYDMDYSNALMLLCVYVLPVHLLWLLFMWYAKDGRYDMDDPGKPILSFLHPWLIDLPAALALPFLIATMGAAQTVIPIHLPQAIGFTLPDIPIRSEWWFASVVISCAYAAVAILTVEPPRFGFRRWRLMRGKSGKLKFDTARVAVKPLGRMR